VREQADVHERLPDADRVHGERRGEHDADRERDDDAGVPEADVGPRVGQAQDDGRGTLTQNMNRQDRWVRMAPPMSGPKMGPSSAGSATYGRPLWSHEIFRRAHERGEINLEKISPAVLALPFDLMRHDLLLTLKPASEKRILEIVDDLFLPLVRLTAAGRPSALPVRRQFRK
jgi:hypothetical protein